MAETIGTAYVQIEPSFEGVVPKIDKEFGGAGKESGNSFMSGFGSVMGTVGKVVAGATTAATAAVGGLVKSAVSAYSEFEQLEGGTKLLFGDAYQTVLDNANNAFAEVQMSANDYLKIANGYAVGLKESLGNDAQAAADLTNRIITAQADIVAATGNDAESVANAFAGIMKNNFTMLDNLQLGIKPTKEGMQEVIEQMNKLNGTKYEMGNLADMQSAIVDYVKYVKMAGYAHEEGSKTIQGSLAATKGAWDNLLTSLGTGDTSKISDSINNLVDTASALGANVMPIVEQALGGISELIQRLAPEIASAIPDLITSILPGLMESGVEIIQSLGEGILSAIPQLMPTLTSVVVQLCQMLVQMLPQLITIGLQVIQSLARGIAQALPTLIPTIVDVVMQIVDYLIQNIPLLIEAAIQLLQGLADGLIQAIPVLVGYIPQIITSIVDALVVGGPMLVDGAIQLVMAIVQALPEINQALIDALPTVIQAIADALPVLVPALIQGAIQLTLALVAALPQIIAGLINAIPSCVEAIVQAFVILGPALTEAFTTAFDELIPAFQELGVVAQQGWEAIKTAFANVAPWFKTKFTEAINNIKTVFNTIKSFFQQKYNEIVQVFANIGAAFKQVGVNIVEGIKQGIGGTWERLKTFVKELVGDLVAFAKKILGIASPSKVFAKEVGQWIPAGIANGIDRGMGTLKKQINEMTNEALSGTISASVETVNSASFIPEAKISDESRPIIFNNTITVNGAEDAEAWTQTFIRTLKREARMA